MIHFAQPFSDSFVKKFDLFFFFNVTDLNYLFIFFMQSIYYDKQVLRIGIFSLFLHENKNVPHTPLLDYLFTR